MVIRLFQVAASIYTQIETPTSISGDEVTATSIKISAGSASGSFSNLTTANSGLYFENVTLGTNSGWIQTNSWISDSLTNGVEYTFRVKARNGDSLETASIETKITATSEPQPIISGSKGVGINSGSGGASKVLVGLSNLIKINTSTT